MIKMSCLVSMIGKCTLRNWYSCLVLAIILSVINLFVVLLVQFLQVDALTTKRGKEGGWVVERLLNQV